MRKYNLEQLASLVASTEMLLKVCSNISEEEAERLGKTKDEIELMGLRLANFINDAEFTIKGGSV